MCVVLAMKQLFNKLTQIVDRQMSSLIDGYPWADLGDRPVVDVGGGSGHVSIELAKVWSYESIYHVIKADERSEVSDASSSGSRPQSGYVSKKIQRGPRTSGRSCFLHEP